MKPYLQEKKVNYFPSKMDHHVRKKNKTIGNWWEDFCNFISRRKMKQKIKREIDGAQNNSHE